MGDAPADIGTLGKYSATIAVVGQPDGSRALSMRVTDSTTAGPKTEVRLAVVPTRDARLWLRTEMDLTPRPRCSRTARDGRRFTPLGGGVLDVDRFTMSH